MEKDRLLEALKREKFIFDPESEKDVRALRQDVRRIAGEMDDDQSPPPMYWSGVPLPERHAEIADTPCSMIVSVGGSKTFFCLLRLEKGELCGYDWINGNEIRDADRIARLQSESEIKTPGFCDEIQTGRQMVRSIVSRIDGKIGSLDKIAGFCDQVVLSWGFPHRVVRTGPRVKDGLAGIVTEMTKDQRPFIQDLKGRDIGEIFKGQFGRVAGWEPSVAVVNDSVAAIHYFFQPGWRKTFDRAGLFVNGTGANFAMAEPFAAEADEVAGDKATLRPLRRLDRERALIPEEKTMDYFVNYEAGSTRLSATRTRFDLAEDYPFERNALAGGNAFPQMFESIIRALLSDSLYSRLLEATSAAQGRIIDRIDAERIGWLCAAEGKDGVSGLFGDIGMTAEEAECLVAAAQAVAGRSAMHAAMILCAATVRNGFGFGRDRMPDFVGMEGSIWKVRGYSGLVKSWWDRLVGGEKLSVRFGHAPGYNASLYGPVFFAALQLRD